MARFRRRGSFKRRNFKRKRGRTIQRKRIFRKRVKFAVNSFAEKKAKEGTIAGSVTNASTTTILNSSIVQGTGGNQRVGNNVYWRSLKLRLYFNNQNDADEVRWRVIVGVWHDYSSTSPNQSAILQNPTAETTSFLNRNELQQKTWKPILDKTFTTRQILAGPLSKTMKINIHGKRLPNKRGTFAAGNVIQDAYFIYMQSSYVGVGTAPDVQGHYRLTFTDV